MDGSFGAFLAISVVVIVTPGQDTALTIRNTLLGGRRAGVFTAIGVAAGQLVWAVAASVGITAVLVASEQVFGAIRLAGAAYLIFLGVSALWSALRRSGLGDSAPTAGAASARSPRHAIRQGLLSNLGNPKMAIFLSSLLPQFAPAEGPAFVAMLGFGVVFATITLVWLCGYACLVARTGVVLRRLVIRRAVDAVTGVTLVVLGLRVATAPSVIER